jgi:hypothetical protein
MHRGGGDRSRKREIVPEVGTSTVSPESGQQMGGRNLTRVRVREVNDDAKERKRENKKLMGSEW